MEPCPLFVFGLLLDFLHPNKKNAMIVVAKKS
jgi:hypothetical protein